MEDPLLALAEAADQLGVHPATLRRWADHGKVAVVVTPGGHRRFLQSEIERLRQQAFVVQKPEVLEALWAERALSHTRTELASRPNPDWLSHLDEADRLAHRRHGHRLMGLLMQYISDEAEAEVVLSEAEAMGVIYATQAQEAGLNMVEALQATMFFRDNLIESVMLLSESKQTVPAKNHQLFHRVTTFLNTIQLAIAQAYQTVS